MITETGGGLVALAGLAFAIIALVNIGRCGSDGLLGKGALGLMLNGGFALIIATNLVAGRERQPLLTPEAPDASAQQAPEHPPGG